MTREASRPAGTTMRLIADRSVTAKILITLATLASACTAVLVVGIAQMGALSRSSTAIYADSLLPVRTLGELGITINGMRSDLLNLGLSQTEQDRSRYLGAISADDGKIDTALATYRAQAPEQADRIDALAALLEQYRQVRDDRMIPLAKAGDFDQLVAVRDEQAAPLAAKIAAQRSALNESETDQAKLAEHRAVNAYDHGRMWMLAVFVLGLALALGLGIWVAELIVRPLRQVSTVVEAMAGGDLTRQVEGGFDDEVGRMARGLDRALLAIRGGVQMMAGSAEALAAAAQQLSASSAQIASAAQESSSRSGSVSAAAEQVSRSVQTVASGSEEMSASISEIAATAQEAARIGARAGEVAAATNQTVGKLGESSAEIGNVVKLITSIAEQTNLLALNATIEAARAGDAGRGFAVVASEVKDLAQETARATGDISQRIEAIQADTTDAVTAIGEISAIINQLGDYQTTIASAVEEQTATTNDISRNVSEAACGAHEIASNITTVSSAAETTMVGVTQTQSSAMELARMSQELRSQVGQFRY